VRRGRILEELWKNCERIVERFCDWMILPQFFRTSLPDEGKGKTFYNSSTIFLQFFLVWKNLVHPDWLGEEL
jgi:hypothetical protein